MSVQSHRARYSFTTLSWRNDTTEVFTCVKNDYMTRISSKKLSGNNSEIVLLISIVILYICRCYDSLFYNLFTNKISEHHVAF